MFTLPDFNNLPPDQELYPLTDEVVLDRLRLNVGYMCFAGSSRSDAIERLQLLMELTRRGVPDAAIDAAVLRGHEEGTEIRNSL